MTDPQTPATEAGRRLSSTEKRFCSAAYDRGRADALREAAERVRALPVTAGLTNKPLVELIPVLAILDPDS